MQDFKLQMAQRGSGPVGDYSFRTLACGDAVVIDKECNVMANAVSALLIRTDKLSGLTTDRGLCISGNTLFQNNVIINGTLSGNNGPLEIVGDVAFLGNIVTIV